MKQPNILYIMSDDHASNAISAYGSVLKDVCVTPNLDRIGVEGAIAKNCCCTNSICTPSRACILTGTYSHVNGVNTLKDGYDGRFVTFPEIFHDHGYETGIVGKWHMHCTPKGFDFVEILANQGLYFDPIFFGKDATWDEEVYNQDVDLNEKAMMPIYGKRNRGYVSDVITDKCMDFLQNRDTSKPFMLLCHHKAPHDYFEYHPRYEHLLDDVEIPYPESLFEDKSHRSEGSRDYGSTLSSKSNNRRMVEQVCSDIYPHPKLNFDGLSEEEKTKRTYQQYLKDYIRTVKGIDDSVGEMLDYLEQTGELDNTIVVYTSDQGMFLGEHDYIDKRWIFDESMKMPLMIRYPKKIKENTVIEHAMNNVDYAQTLLDLAGLPAPEHMQGKSFVPLLVSPDAEWDDTVYYRYWMHLRAHEVPAHLGLRTNDYKLIFFYGKGLGAAGAVEEDTPQSWELYDLKNDPFEMKNVFDDPAYAQVKADMIAHLKLEKARVKDDDDILEGVTAY